MEGRAVDKSRQEVITRIEAKCIMFQMVFLLPNCMWQVYLGILTFYHCFSEQLAVSFYRTEVGLKELLGIVEVGLYLSRR